MRLPRFQLRVRTLLAVVALIALALVGQRIYHDGPEAHWLLLKLRHGNVEARRSAARDALESESRVVLHDMVDGFLKGVVNPRVAEQKWRRRRRRAELLFPALVQAAKDPDASCRGNAIEALGFLAGLYASETEKRQALRHILVATRDPKDSVRAAAVDSLASLADRDKEAVVAAPRLAMTDPSVDVRQKAAWELGSLGVLHPETQSDVAPILTRLLASREDPRVRSKAAWGMWYLGVDQRRHPPGSGPDVVPALVAALRDPAVEVRRTAARVLGSTATDIQARPISSWEQRKASIIPALEEALTDKSNVVREESARALFSLGQRPRRHGADRAGSA